MNNVVLTKVDGVVSVELADKENTQIFHDDTVKHLCWENCEFAYADKCPKVANKNKKTIDKYPFVTDGMQLLDDENKVDRFIVTGCNKYKKTVPIERTREELAYLKKVKEGLKMAYFDAGSIEEANVIQYEIVRHNMDRKRKENIAKGLKPDTDIKSVIPKGKVLTPQQYGKLIRHKSEWR